MERTYKRWTAADEELLERYYGKENTDKLRARLGVSYSRFRRKVKALGLGYQRESDELVTMRQVREMLGVQHYAIQRFVKAGLPIIRRKFGKRTNIMIRLSALLDWLERHQDMWSAIKVEYMAFGTEPQWLRDKRRCEYAERRKA